LLGCRAASRVWIKQRADKALRCWALGFKDLKIRGECDLGLLGTRNELWNVRQNLGLVCDQLGHPHRHVRLKRKPMNRTGGGNVTNEARNIFSFREKLMGDPPLCRSTLHYCRGQGRKEYCPAHWELLHTGKRAGRAGGGNIPQMKPPFGRGEVRPG
jgi:hypothetical protein